MKYLLKKICFYLLLITVLAIALPSLRILERMISEDNFKFDQFIEGFERFDLKIGAAYAFFSILVAIVFENFNGHKLFKTPINLGINIGESRYDYWHLSEKAKKKIILCGQNHYYLSIKEIARFSRTIEELNDRGVEITVLMDDIRFVETSISWLTVNIPDINYTENYKAFDVEQLKQNIYFKQLIQATINFNELQNKYSNFKVFTKPHVPISMTFVDPEGSNAFIVIPQNFFNANHVIRPFFLVHKKWSESVFDSYWHTYKHKIRLEDTLPTFEKKINNDDVIISFEHGLSVTMDEKCRKIKEIEFN